MELIRPDVLLTGATGLLGSFLCRDLLLGGYRLNVLVRERQGVAASERVAALVASWSEECGQTLPTPTVLVGELSPDGTGLSPADERRLRQTRPIVLHCAANLSFRATPQGEPTRTNVGGTAVLLELCRRASLSRFHLVSTAFVCGRRQGCIGEEDLDQGQDFHNPYEQSKFAAEQLVRQAAGIEPTIYRPAVIVGDSRTGRTTTFTGLYRILELAVRLAEPPDRTGFRRLSLRLPLLGDEPCHLVPVDWVSRAIVELLGRPEWHRRTFHLTGPAATTRLIRDVAVEVLRLTGVRLVGPEGWSDPSHLEQAFWEGVQEYWPYLTGTPNFDERNTRTALPDLPPPLIDRPLLRRLFRFAEDANWGHRTRRPAPSESACADYIERTFPQQARQSRLAQAAGLDLVVAFDVRGAGGGQWSCEWVEGEFREVRRGLSDRARVVYHLDTQTFEAVIAGRLSPQQAFFDRCLEVTGDLETALKLAVLFDYFLKESPQERHADMEGSHGSSRRPPAVRR